jgi:hypothetical protein
MSHAIGKVYLYLCIADYFINWQNILIVPQTGINLNK